MKKKKKLSKIAMIIIKFGTLVAMTIWTISTLWIGYTFGTVPWFLCLLFGLAVLIFTKIQLIIMDPKIQLPGSNPLITYTIINTVSMILQTLSIMALSWELNIRIIWMFVLVGCNFIVSETHKKYYKFLVEREG